MVNGVTAGALATLVTAGIIGGLGASVHAATSCEGLASMALPGATVTIAEVVAAGAFVPPGGNSSAASKALPPFCRVAATLKPSSDSDINIEVWMPASNWNGKLMAVGNGAFNGNIDYTPMMAALSRGYATASTDTGHTGGGARWALGHPDKVIDFGWRAVHEMTVASKTLVAARYDSAPRFSYWNGCSAGGRQGLQAAQRFPSDFDGIIAGAPGLDWTGRATQAVRVAQRLEHNEAAQLLAPKRQLLHSAVVTACDQLDGVKDGLIANPRACRFDPGVLQCKASDTASCLTPPQVETARLIYSPAVNSSTNREITGLERGSELGWTDLGWTAGARATGLDQFRYLVFADPEWDLRRFNPAADPARAEAADNNTINALNPNLKPFLDRGGKVIQYHGWSDPQISPGASTQYYNHVVETLGGAARVHASYRLFMAPGMGHCGGGEGPNSFDMVAALEQWVEGGTPPERIIASQSTNGSVSRTRPLCPYPQVAAYTGSGSIDAAESFVCRAK